MRPIVRASFVLVLGLAGCHAPTAPTVQPISLQALLASEQQMRLQAGTASVLHQQPEPAKAKGTLIMYHGFTAGTWQYDLLAKRAFEAGYNVYVPRLPGHGFKDADGLVSSRELPTARTAYQYEDFAERTFQQAASLGAPISVLGLSVGGSVALRVAEKHPDEVQRTVLYAPFLRPRTLGWVFDAARGADVVPLNVGDGTLQSVNWGWGPECEADEASGKRGGHCKFTLGNINGALAFGATALDQARAVKSPIQFFVTAMDDAAEEDAIKRAYLAAGGAARHGWYYYPEAEGIPHPMLHPMEDKGKGHTPALYDMTMRFLAGEASNRGDLPK
jgi:pimeloyl-ACP methyl ester carboxylesterase